MLLPSHNMKTVSRIIQPHAIHKHTHTRLTALFPGLPRRASTRKVKPIWILLKQEMLSGPYASLHLAPDRQPHQLPSPHHSVFTGQMPFLPPNQQRQSTEGMQLTKFKQNHILLTTHPFNGLFCSTTWVSRYRKGKTSLDLDETRDDGVLRCSGISWTTCKQSAPCSLETGNHTNTSSQFLQTGCST